MKGFNFILFVVLLAVANVVFFIHNIERIGMSLLFNSEKINLVLLLIILVICSKNLYRQKDAVIVLEKKINVLAVTLYLFSLLLYIGIEYFIGTRSLLTIAFGLSMFCLMGIFIVPERWLRSFIPLFLILFTLPYGNLLDTFIGFPLRLEASKIVGVLLDHLRVGYFSTETIINIESHSVQIDSSCSGLKGIWSASIFYFLLTWIEKIKIGWRWFALYLLLISLLLLANLFRISVLVILELVLLKPELANFFHVPLGLIGFIFSCLTVALIVKFRKKEILPETTVSENAYRLLSIKEISRSRLLTIGATALCVLSLGFYLRVTKVSEQFNPDFNVSFTIANAKDIALSAQEIKYFREEGSVAIKKSFSEDSLSGSLLLVKSNTFPGHHHPENCVQSMGLNISKATTIFIDKDFSLKLLSLNNGALFQCYWFQSPSKITDDFSARIWSELAGDEKNWIMVSVLFNHPIEMDAHTVQVLKTIKNNIRQSQPSKILSYECN